MTGDEIRALPDRELDAAIAEKVMGWGWVRCSGPKETWVLHSSENVARSRTALFRTSDELPIGAEPLFGNVPHYSADIAAAFEVVKHMEDAGYSWKLTNVPMFSSGVMAKFVRGVPLPNGQADGVAVHQSAARAISEASILAVQHSSKL